MQKIIAVTMSIDTILTREVNFLNFEYSQFVQQLGYTPLFIPNDLDYRPFLEKLPVSALIITGGHDLDLDYPGKKKEQLGSVTPLRDVQETTLLNWAMGRELPVFGICRGMQLMNIVLGGDLTSDLASEHPENVNLHRRTTHQIKLTYQQEAEYTINSFHHQGVTASQLAPGLEILAVSAEDQQVEAFVHTEKLLLAVQWHPERAAGQFELTQKMMKEYLSL